jgi:hypothetical protein
VKLIIKSGLMNRVPVGLADGFIAKPYSPAEVIRCIDRLLEDGATPVPYVDDRIRQLPAARGRAEE